MGKKSMVVTIYLREICSKYQLRRDWVSFVKFFLATFQKVWGQTCLGNFGNNLWWFFQSQKPFWERSQSGEGCEGNLVQDL